MGGSKSLRCAIGEEVSTESFDKTRVKSINEYLADAYGKWILVNERTGGTQDLPVIIKDWLEDDVALCVLVSLPDVVKGGMRLLVVTWAELVEQALKDGWGGKHDDFCAYLGDQGSTVYPCQSEVEHGGQKVDRSILKSDDKDVTLISIGCNGA